MIRLILISISFFLMVPLSKLQAQNFQGVATYKSHRKMDIKFDDEKMNAEMQKDLQAQISKQFQKEYTLKFNATESVYKEVEQLETPVPSKSGMVFRISDGSDELYKNIREKKYTNATELYGKLFLVEDSLTTRKWELSKETKHIGEYLCFKASYTEDYETETFNQEGKITKETKTRTVTAWYTPQIPISNGPQMYQGLPGLILEINDGELTLICNKIVLNPEESLKIEAPSKGKEVSQAEYDAIVKKKTEEMMERFRSSSRSKDGDKMIIKIGG